jgi:hypothetical protein
MKKQEPDRMPYWLFRHPAWMRMFLIITIAGLALIPSACDWFDKAKNITTQTVNALDDAIDSLSTQSANWQQVLQDTMGKLTDTAQSTIRNEIANLASRSVAQVGVEFRCNADFIGARVRQALIAIKANLLNQPVPPIEPAVCQAVPLAIDRSLVPDRLKQLEFYGYDFDKASNLRVLHERTPGRIDVTSKLNRPTHYAMILHFGANGVGLDNSSQKISLEWGGKQISQIAVIQPVTPICQSKLMPFTPQSITYIPPKTGSGDGDFDGNGPKVIVKVSLIVRPKQLSALVYMSAKETQDDWTHAEGWREFPLYSPDPGWSINSVVGDLSSDYQYTDSNHTDDSFDLGSGGPVKRLVFVGDTDSDEAGTRTKADIAFNALRMELIQSADCVADSAVTNSVAAGLISPALFRRLLPSINQQRLKRNLQVFQPN